MSGIATSLALRNKTSGYNSGVHFGPLSHYSSNLQLFGSVIVGVDNPDQSSSSQ